MVLSPLTKRVFTAGRSESTQLKRLGCLWAYKDCFFCQDRQFFIGTKTVWFLLNQLSCFKGKWTLTAEATYTSLLLLWFHCTPALTHSLQYFSAGKENFNKCTWVNTFQLLYGTRHLAMEDLVMQQQEKTRHAIFSNMRTCTSLSLLYHWTCNYLLSYLQPIDLPHTTKQVSSMVVC